MPQFHVDENLARLIERLAGPKPFENITFNDALKRIVERQLGAGIKEVLAPEPGTSAIVTKKAPSPSARDWADAVPELSGNKALMTWKAICDYLGIDTAGDSARRKLKSWVKDNRPKWPKVPEC